MTNPTSARRAAATDLDDAPRAPTRRRPLARVLSAGVALAACLLLAAVAAAEGQAAPLILALWVGVLMIAGTKLSRPVARPAPARPAKAPSRVSTTLRMRAARRPVLMLAELDAAGNVGATRTHPIVASDAAIAVIDARPRG